jgi:hypothetical protein
MDPMKGPSSAGSDADSRSIDERADAVPIQLVPMRVPAAGGEAPMVDRLALVGEPVTSVIGRPVIATSDVDVTGTSVLHFNQIAQKRPTGLGPIDLLIIGTVALCTGFFAFLVAQLLLEGPGSGPVLPAILALVSMPIAAWVSYRYSRRPNRKGRTCVVGEHGLQVGTVVEGALDRCVVSYADPSDTWFELTSLGVRPGSGATLSASRILNIAATDDPTRIAVQLDGTLSILAMNRPLAQAGAARIEAERFFAIGEAWERGRAIRLGLAERALRSGRAVVMPTSDGRRVTLTPRTDAGGALALTLEITRGGSTLLRGGPGEVTVDLQQGTYEIAASGRRETIARGRLGDAYVLDAFYLGDRGLPIPAEGALPRDALIPAPLRGR